MAVDPDPNACLLPIDEAMSVVEGGWIHIEGDTIVALGSGEPPRLTRLKFSMPAATLSCRAW